MPDAMTMKLPCFWLTSVGDAFKTAAETAMLTAGGTPQAQLGDG